VSKFQPRVEKFELKVPVKAFGRKIEGVGGRYDNKWDEVEAEEEKEKMTDRKKKEWRVDG
jgi:hypothetical protein